MTRITHTPDRVTGPGTTEARGRKMTDKELAAYLLRKIDQAMNDEEGEISDVRADAFNRYLGREQGPDRDGHSRFTTRETFEVVEWMLPHIISAFTGQGDVVEFIPSGEDDEYRSKVETDIVNYHFRRHNYGFMALYSWVKDALMQPVGYIKVYPHTTRKKTYDKYRGLTAEELAKLSETEDTRVTSLDVRTVDVTVPPDIAAGLMPPQPPGAPPVPPPPGGTPSPGGPGGPVPPGPAMAPEPLTVQMEVYDVEIERMKESTVIKLDPLPPEEVLVDRDLTSLDLDLADTVIHRTRYEIGELIAMGFDKKKLDEIGPDIEAHEWNDERVNRLFYEDEDPDQWSEDDASIRKYWLYEAYARLDYDGDGEPEPMQIFMAGSTILEVKPVDYQPIIAMSSIPLSHKHNGTSFAETVRELQEVQTELNRQLLDNIYSLNIRKKFIDENQFTDDFSTVDYLQQVDSEWIPMKGPPAQGVLFEPTTAIVGDIISAKEAMSEITKMRTGVAPDLNVDPNVLQQSTAAAFTQAQNGAHQRIAMTIRIMAETGLKVLYTKWRDLMRRYLDDDLFAHVSNEWITYNPTQWREDREAMVNVGLGHANRDQMMQVLMAVLMEQKEAMAMGLTKPKHLYATYSRLVNASGVGKPELFFDDPEAPDFIPPQPPPPDPVQMAQAKMLEAEAQKSMVESQTRAQELQMKAQEAQMKVQEAQIKAMAEQRKMELEQEKSQVELRLKMEEAALKRAEMQLKQADLQLKQAELSAKAEQIASDVGNTDADTVLKLANARKALTDASVTLNPPMPDTSGEKEETGKKIDAVASDLKKEIQQVVKSQGKKKTAKRFKVKRGADGEMESLDVEYGPEDKT